MGDPSQQGREALRDVARERIESSRLPKSKPARIWGGHGTGQTCSLCDKPILENEPEMELEYEGAASQPVVRFHLQCQSVWDEARQAFSSPWTLVSAQLPPLLQIVEARIAMSPQRTVILGVMRVNHGNTGPLVWLNATTNSPLPPSWQVIEWRPSAEQPVSAPAELTPDRASSHRA